MRSPVFKRAHPAHTCRRPVRCVLMLLLSLSLHATRPAAQDASRVAAERAFAEAEALIEQGEIEPIRKAIGKYEETIPLYRAAGDRRGEATALERLGAVYHALGEGQKALEYYGRALSVWRDAEDPHKTAATLAALGKLYHDAGQTRKALEQYRQALTLYRAAGDRRDEALTLSNIAGFHDELGEKQKAIESFLQALPLYHALGDLSSEAATNHNVGGTFDELGERRKALEYYERALPLWRAAGDRRGEAVTASNAAKVYNVLGDKSKALEHFERALLLYHAVEDSRGEARTLNNIGVIHSSLEAKEKALEYYGRALPLWRAARDRGGEAETFVYIAKVHDYLGRKVEAIESFTSAVSLYAAVEDRGAQARTLNDIGIAYDSFGEARKALGYIEEALRLYRAAKDDGNVASTLNNLGSVYHALGENQRALGYYEEALRLHHAGGNESGEATALNNIGALYSSLGERQKALDNFNRALPLYRAAKDPGGEATTFNNIGKVYGDSGEGRNALRAYARALSLYHAVGDRGGEGTTLNNIGFAYYDAGERQKALRNYEKALPLHRSVQSRGGEAATLNNMGMVYDDAGESRKALEQYEKALLLHRAVGDRGGEAATLNNMGSVYDTLGEKGRALEHYGQALLLYRSVGDLNGEVVTLANLAGGERDRGNLTGALARIEEALSTVENLRTKIVSQELRSSYFATARRFYDFYIDLLMRLHQQQSAAGYDAAALHASERSRARSLLELLTEARVGIRQGVDPSLVERERALQQQLNDRARRQKQLRPGGPLAAPQAEELLREVEDLLAELRQTRALIRETSPRYAELTQPRALTLREIQTQALDDDTLLLEYSLGNEQSYLWAVTPTAAAAFKLPKRAEVEAATRAYYGLLNVAAGVRKGAGRKGGTGSGEADGWERQMSEAASRLSRMLLGPVAAQLGRKRLLIVADGALEYLPFAALPEPSVNGQRAGVEQPLVVNHELVSLPSISVLMTLRKESAGRRPAPGMLAVLADPVFRPDDKRVGQNPDAASSSRPKPSAARRSVRRVRAGRDGESLVRLPASRKEAEGILALVPAERAMSAFDFDASRALASSGVLGQYRYVHFATHGQLDSVNPELSAIVLSLVDRSGNPQDGFLRAHEVYNLDLPADLVVLSGCQTGLGKEIRGEGLVGLTRGFMYAGAARVVTSLWRVDDEAAAELMVNFYRGMLEEGERPAAALRSAQLRMLRQGRWQSPRYWAAFVLQGEWR